MISVVIPTYNEEENIKKCLDSVVRQRLKTPLEIIVVDNNSSDNTGQILDYYRKRYNIYPIFEKKKGRGPARRAGFNQARGNIILSTDADVIVSHNWAQQLVQSLGKHKADAISGSCYFNDCDENTNSQFATFNPLIRVTYRFSFGHYYLAGYNFAIYKKIYEKAGGFHKTLNSHEDLDLSLRVGRIGTIAYDPTIKVAASGRRFRRGLLQGFGAYVKPFIEWYYFKKKSMHLNDIR